MKLLEYIWAYLCHVCGGVKILFPCRIDKVTVFEKPNYIGRHCVLIQRLVDIPTLVTIVSFIIPKSVVFVELQMM